MYADEGKAGAVQLVRNAVAYYKSLAVQVRAPLTDNGSAFRSKDFAQTRIELNSPIALLDPLGGCAPFAAG